MCGFVGIRYGGDYPFSEGSLDRAITALRHRGPDGKGRFVAKGLSLGHARLSIIDLSEAASQPMVGGGGRYVLVFNGEIYNYRELADRYFADDVSLNRASDTAVLLAMFMRFGRNCLHHLNGMFAFAVADLHEKTLFLARDRFGEKPMYWLRTGSLVAFASEIAALRQLLPNEPWSIASVSLTLYHVVGSIPAPHTIYQNVRALRAGHWVEIDASGNTREGEYWSLQQQETAHVQDHEAAIAGCQTRLLDAVGSRMVSDVPVGVFLSGGLDSGSILSLVSSIAVPRPDALCIDFPDPRFSEYHLAAMTAQEFGVRLHRSVVTPESFMEHLGAFFAAADQPTTDGFNSFFVAMHARALGIKVWLSGVGGDELFGGYPSFRKIGRLRTLSSMLQACMPRIAPVVWARHFPRRLRSSRLLHLGLPGESTKRAYQTLRNTLARTNANNFLSSAMRLDVNDAIAILDSIYPSTDYCLDSYQRASAMESGVYMASQLLRDIDNFSMAHSIETRAPFLDHRLFGFVFSLPQRFKQRNGQGKPLLVDSLPRPLPALVALQPKRGFTFPMETWLMRDMRESFEQNVLIERNKMFWDLDALAQLWLTYERGGIHWSVLWQFYAFARWYEAHHA